MNLTTRQIMILGGGLAAVLIVGYLLVANLRSNTDPKRVTLRVWGTEDDSAMKLLAQGYKAANPNVTVEYSEFDPQSFERRIVDALAAGEGPDVFMLPNLSLPRHANKLLPAGSRFTQADLREYYPRIIEENVFISGDVYGLPLYIDTLALLYDGTALEQASIVDPPKTWEEFQAFVPYLRVLNDNGQVVKAAAGIGGSETSVDYATEILSLLIMQNGGAVSDGTRITLASPQGVDALNFYLQFASPGPTFTWAETQPRSLAAFSEGKAAMALGYREDLLELRAKNPFLRAQASAAPQVGTQAVNFARYQTLVVSKQSRNAGWAWDFVIYAGWNPSAQKTFSEATGKLSALKSLLGTKINDPELGVFARQALTARSWYAFDDGAIRDALDKAIRDALSGRASPAEALRTAESNLNVLMNRR